jgi:hypothetical protein
MISEQQKCLAQIMDCVIIPQEKYNTNRITNQLKILEIDNEDLTKSHKKK